MCDHLGTNWAGLISYNENKHIRDLEPGIYFFNGGWYPISQKDIDEYKSLINTGDAHECPTKVISTMPSMSW